MNSSFAKWLHQKVMGWQIVGTFPQDVNKAIIVVAPHTSNWDFLHGFLTRAIQKFPSNFMIKNDWLKKPVIGKWFVNQGGVGVDRSKNMKLTDQIVEKFEERDQFVIAITPEGTRKYNPNWKSGFWYIAKKANVPLVPATFDYPTKRVIWHEPFYLTDDKDADFERLRQLFVQYEGKHPEQGVK